MKRFIACAAIGAAVVLGGALASLARAEDVQIDGKSYRKISVAEYRDKMKGGWIGQIAGVCWGAPTEFRYCGRIIPEEEAPKWTPDMINHAFGQDDIYVEMTFLRTMEEHGLDCSIRQAGIDFANSEYPLWHANVHGRKNLRRGIAPPNSGRPEFSHCADDIDYQIESDFSGLISPGLPNNAVRMGEKFGRLMNYGDGMYAGQFIGAMYAEAFFETDVVKIVEKALKAIPEGSGYAEMVRDLLQWKKEIPDDWQACWQKINEKYQLNPDYRKWSCTDVKGDFNIDVKINGAYVLVGLLYGNGDLDETIKIAFRCGQDSDCNPSSAAGVLFTTLGFSALPPRFSENLDEETRFSHTEYNFPALINVCESLATQAVEKEGGFVREENGERYFYIPKTEIVPSALTSCAAPTDRPLEGEEGFFTEEELAQLRFRELSEEEFFQKYMLGFKVEAMGPDMDPGQRHEYRGHKNVYLTHPVDRENGAILAGTVKAGAKTKLRFDVTYHVAGEIVGDFDLIVKVDGKEVLNETVSEKTVAEDGWRHVEIDLSEFAGKDVAVQIINQPNGWYFEGAYFSDFSLVDAE